MIIHCNNCGKQIKKGKWCSDKCRKSFARVHANPDKKSDKINPDTSQVGQKMPNPDKHTETDQLFVDDAMARGLGNYYVFDDDTYKHKCLQCDRYFDTQLSLLRFCSPQCRAASLSCIV